MKHILLSMLTLFFLGAASAQTPTEYIKTRYNEVNALLEKPQAEREAGIQVIVEGSIDYDDFTQRSLGRHWVKLTEAQQKKYNETFRTLIRLTYVERLGDRNPNSDYELEWEPEEIDGDLARVLIVASQEDTLTDIEFILKRAGSTWTIHNVLFDGIGAEETYRKNYGKILRKEGFDGLIKKMEDRISELEAP